MALEQRVIEELETIREQDDEGKLVPEAVVAFAAKHPDSALHKRFTWDDSEAAVAYRLWQARQLIAVAVVVIADDKPAYRAYVSLSSDRRLGGGYRSIDVVLRSKRMYAELLEDALKDLKRMEEKYGQLQELQDIWKAAQKVRRLHRTAREPAAV